MTQLLAILKSLIPILEPLGEQGIEALWVYVDAEIAQMSGDSKDICLVLSPAFKQVALLELRKLKAA